MRELYQNLPNNYLAFKTRHFQLPNTQVAQSHFVYLEQNRGCLNLQCFNSQPQSHYLFQNVGKGHIASGVRKKTERKKSWGKIHLLSILYLNHAFVDINFLRKLNSGWQNCKWYLRLVRSPTHMCLMWPIKFAWFKAKMLTTFDHFDKGMSVIMVYIKVVLHISLFDHVQQAAMLQNSHSENQLNVWDRISPTGADTFFFPLAFFHYHGW